MEKTLSDLIEISHYAAQHPRLVQGGGGNCSVKAKDRRWVKASGYFLEDISASGGYAILDAVSGMPVDESKGKASMEAPLHTLLGDYVIHTHPIAVAAFVSSEEAKADFRSIFPESCYVWIDYAPPGKLLFEKVKETISAEAIRGNLILFLQNHGLFVSSPSKEQCMRLHEETVKRLEIFFGPCQDLPVIPSGKFLTPDHAVYEHLAAPDLSVKQRISVEETLLFARHALSLIKAKGWNPHWLPEDQIAFVLGMDQEKYRQQIWKKP